ncbi:PRC-barrel domain-containing protein [Noviherbaspirillum aridicola]|uniref:PRC-barrel domain-containing protein n=1 Tax=Noviherbaspirillum aridicola TaxID=2849687 RepID=A0ABQ4Q9N0_9BURK|nr:PRC-barrel domain-containing protein [Noviherbaspirillum aridicola]GIZ53769.1 hypothetical protein NCCP691_37830 [Noviherbaspirillum aridicola]
MKRLVTTALVAILAMSSTASMAATAEGGRAGKPSLDQQELYRGSRIIGAAVHDARDRKIGEVKDLLLDSARGEVAYAILGFGGRKLHPVPWRALMPSESGRNYVLDADREVIAQAPGFDMGEWPDTGNQRWSEDIDRYWNRMVGRATDAGQASAAGTPPAAASSGGSGKPGSGNAGRGDRR